MDKEIDYTGVETLRIVHEKDGKTVRDFIVVKKYHPWAFNSISGIMDAHYNEQQEGVRRRRVVLDGKCPQCGTIGPIISDGFGKLLCESCRKEKDEPRVKRGK